MPRPDASSPQEMRLVGRLVLGAGVAAVGVIPFLGLLLLVESHYDGLADLDRSVADELNRWALSHPHVVDVLTFLQTALSPNVFRLAVLLVAVLLWRAGSRRLAIWAVMTTALGALLGVVLKQLVHRARPSFTDPVASAGSYSFPSGHALGSFLGAGVLLLILLPLLGRRGRACAWAVAATLVVLTGLDRVALGVHFVSDVLAGWFAAAAVLAGTTTAFGAWRGHLHLGRGLDPLGSWRTVWQLQRRRTGR
ncbi:MAG: PA-phosphatase-like phosphoesterase [Frankiales bacterium]|nr:PA-phosphatase-like phosphoesterase [Frankiales bacterium]